MRLFTEDEIESHQFGVIEGFNDEDPDDLGIIVPNFLFDGAYCEGSEAGNCLIEGDLIVVPFMLYDVDEISENHKHVELVCRGMEDIDEYEDVLIIKEVRERLDLDNLPQDDEKINNWFFRS